MSRSSWALVCALALAVPFSTLSYAVTPDRIAGAVDSSRVVPLQKSLHPRAKSQYDRGPVDPAFSLASMTLLFAPSAAQQNALSKLLAEQQDSSSPNYHRWLTPAQYGERFGLSVNDMNRVTDWLKSQGFAIQSIGGARNAVTFSGTAAQVQRAFKAEIHNYNVEGEEHFANATPIMIPAALNGMVSGIVGVHNFRMYAASRNQAHPTSNLRADYYDGNYIFPNFLSPADIAKMYDIPSTLDGTGQSIAIIGRTDIFLADLNDFRSMFGMTQINSSNCTLNSIGIITACNDPLFKYVLLLPTGITDPGVPDSISQGDITEADLDVEWSSAVAQNAQIIYVNAPSLSGNGTYDSLAAAINPPSGPPLAPIISLSYGICEQFAGISLETELQQGAAEGITIMNSSGDDGAAACDTSPTSNNPNNAPPFLGAFNGQGVSYPASSPYVVAVGGTGISLANDSVPTQSSYWSTTNGTNGGTMQQTIPELSWNDDEAFFLYCTTISSPSPNLCNPSPGVQITTTQTAQEDYWISAGGGGASNCYNENTNNICTGGLPQPTWQQSLVVPSAPASVRYVPDVSLLSSPQLPGYIFCTPLNPDATSPNYTSSCSGGIATAVDTNGSIIGGTSAASPLFAGIVALLNQYLAGPSSPGLGDIHSTLYLLAKTKSNGAFHQVTSGDNVAYCQPGTPAGQPATVICPSTGVNAGKIGFLASNADATTGYNLVTGLGSVDVNNLALAWAAGRTATTLTITPPSAQINFGQNVTFTATASATNAQGNVSFFNNGSTTALGTVAFAKNSNGVVTFSTTALPVGTNNVTASYAGDGLNNPSSTTTSATVTVTQPDFTLASNPTTATVVAGHNSSAITVTIAPVNGYSQATTLSCVTPPTGASCNFALNPMPKGTTTTTLTIATNASMVTGAAPQFNISATNGGSVTHVSPFTLTVTATDQSYTLTPGATSYQVTPGGIVNGASATITLTGTNGFSTTNSPVSYTCSEPATLTESTCNITANATGASFVISTTPPSMARVRPAAHSLRIFYAAMMPGLLGIMFVAGARKRSRRGLRVLGLILGLGLSTLWMASCSGTNGGSKNPGTPAGSYTITVNATTNGTNPLTAQTTFTLQVQ